MLLLSNNHNIKTLVTLFTRNLHTNATTNSSKNLSDILIRGKHQPQISLTTERGEDFFPASGHGLLS